LIIRPAILVTVQVGSQNLLNDMYEDPMRWTTAFQLYSSLTRQGYIVYKQKPPHPRMHAKWSLGCINVFPPFLREI
jgi:hypothetical protein